MTDRGGLATGKWSTSVRQPWFGDGAMSDIKFSYTNTHPFRPDLAQFTHLTCPGRGAQRTGSKSESGKARPSPPSIC
jgi:hypothetical protein